MRVTGRKPRSPTLVRVSGLVTFLGGVLWALWSADFVDFLDLVLWLDRSSSFGRTGPVR